MPHGEYTEISFYIVAHADDWQLFMSPNVYNDLVAPGSKVVWIMTTAGDAGAGETYWRAREEGSKSSVRFCLAPLAALSQSSGTRQFNGHSIHYWSANNATCYSLRLPDGGLDGRGFSAYHNQSLSRFQAGELGAITAVDKSATYRSWFDFSTTIQEIIQFEGSVTSNIWVNYLNPDTAANPNYHPDHIVTGQAIQAMPIISGVHRALFVGYALGSAPEDLDGTDLFWKAGMFAAYEKAVFDGSGYSTLNEDMTLYLGWCLRSARFATLHASDSTREHVLC